MLFVCQSGYETLARTELDWRSGNSLSPYSGPGWLLHSGRVEPLDALAFPHLALQDPAEITGDSVNALASRILDWFLAAVKGQAISEAWPVWWEGPAELNGLGRRISAVQAAFEELLRKRMSRVAKLAQPGAGQGRGAARGLFVWFADFKRAFVARDAWRGGQRRMADDSLAPSRSYLKVEEAYQILGRSPGANETVVDLGAAPGGWSYSAARRGARVLAIDNGPLKGGAADHPLIEHRREDAFKFALLKGQAIDWLFCDLVEEPHHVWSHLLKPWVERRWCRHFIVNLKFGRVDPVGLLKELAPALPPGTLIRHLYHDREEFTLTGSL
jgi:23S rRNA (cytidine2498-2'-O)-methyltransferase